MVLYAISSWSNISSDSPSIYLRGYSLNILFTLTIFFSIHYNITSVLFNFLVSTLSNPFKLHLYKSNTFIPL